MPASPIARRYYNGDDASSSSNYTAIIVVVVVIVVIKICLICALCYWRSKKQAERAARGCHCYDNTDYYCLPWWYWSSDRHCRCGAIQATSYNASPYNAPPYNAPPFSAPPMYTELPQRASPNVNTGDWNTYAAPDGLKPVQPTTNVARYG